MDINKIYTYLYERSVCMVHQLKWLERTARTWTPFQSTLFTSKWKCFGAISECVGENNISHSLFCHINICRIEYRLGSKYHVYCIFRPAFGCCSPKMLVKIFILSIFSAKKLKISKKVTNLVQNLAKNIYTVFSLKVSWHQWNENKTYLNQNIIDINLYWHLHLCNFISFLLKLSVATNAE